MSKLDKEAVIAKFTAAYEAANGKTPQIEAKGGWYSVDGGKNQRLAALDEMANELTSGGGAPATEPAKPAKKTAPKKAAKTKAAPAANSTNGPKVISAGAGKKPADAWKERLQSGANDCTLPRGI